MDSEKHDLRIQQLERTHSTLEDGVRILNREIVELKISIDAAQIHRDYTAQRFNSLEKRMDEGFESLNQIVSRIAWIPVTAVILAVMAYLIKGGMAG